MICKIDVTQDDLAKGVRDDCIDCPVALAIKRHLKEEYRSRVYCSTANLLIYTNEKDKYEIEFPKGIWMKIVKIDSGEKVEPFQFDLDIAEKYVT